MSDWQPIETAPKDGRRIIGFTHPGKYGVETIKWCDGLGQTEYGPDVGWIGVEQDSTCFPGNFRRDPQHQPTHWQPLPAPPPYTEV